ncbi:MAG: hypothetical protein P8L46_03655 [Acidimicrobiales bacterium]|nr:hypothetical protein [Acidimicrobiales bacterium]MDG2217118.1 hypothetical protein [Acidimicrobiales bacterium]
MAGEDDENLSYTQARRRVGLDHVRAVRKAIEDTARPEPTGRRLQPSQSLTEAAVPSPALPGGPPRPVTVRPESSVSQQIADLTATVADLALSIERLTEAHGTDLANATDALAAKYEMELAAHRQTVERLLEHQDAHIETLNGLVQKLTLGD